MIKTIQKIFLLLIIPTTLCYAQNSDNIIRVKGEQMNGYSVNGEIVREVKGNVIITQGNVIINCDNAIQYISKNEVKLIGNVVIKQDSITITTARGYYYGDIKKSVSDTSIKLDDGKVVLTANRGNYLFNDHIAFFRDSVKLKDSVSVLTSDSLRYFKDEDRMYAFSNVTIADSENTIKADSLEHFRDKRITFADQNVKIFNPENNLTMFGNHLEDYPEQHFTLVTERPLLMQIDTSYVKETDSLRTNEEIADSTMKIDTLFIKSVTMEAYRDSLSIFKAIDSVKISRGDFASQNDFTLYKKDDGQIITYKLSDSTAQPILWYEDTQLTGDSVTIFLADNRINSLKVNNNSFIISQDENNPRRFNQMSGDSVKMSFENSKLNRTDVWGNFFSIYYQYDNEEPNGLTKSSSQNAVILFEQNKVNEIRLYLSPNSEYYPEILVKGKEDSFILSRYVAFKQKPGKLLFLIRLN